MCGAVADVQFCPLSDSALLGGHNFHKCGSLNLDNVENASIATSQSLMHSSTSRRRCRRCRRPRWRRSRGARHWSSRRILIYLLYKKKSWSSGYGRRLMFQRSWVRIPAPDTGWTWHFFTLICCKNCIVCLKRPKINEKEAEVGPFFKKKEV